MRKTSVLCLWIILFAAGLLLAAEPYTVDPVHTGVNFAIRHLVISKVTGKFKEFEGTILFDEKDITKSSVEGLVKVASIDTGNEDRDQDLRSANFFDVEKYPNITFKSKKVEKKGEQVMVYGDLTIKGVTKPVVLPVTITGPIQDPWGNTRIGIETRLTIDRRDFGIVWDKRMETGGLVVGNEVEISISAEAIRKAEGK